MSADDPGTLVSTGWLNARLKDPDLRILDASWYLPDMGRDPRAEYDVAHVPNARFLDIDDLSDHRSSLPHAVPPVEKFMSRMRALGIGDGLWLFVLVVQFRERRTWLRKPVVCTHFVVHHGTQVTLHAGALQTDQHGFLCFTQRIQRFLRGFLAGHRIADVLPPQLRQTRVVRHVGPCGRPGNTRRRER